MESICWLIERGQQQGQTPTIWWAGLRVVGQWTDQVNLAIRFNRKEDAEAIAQMYPYLGEKDKMWIAVQHAWFA